MRCNCTNISDICDIGCVSSVIDAASCYGGTWLTITEIDSLSIDRGGYIAASQASGHPEGKSRRGVRVVSKIDSRRRWVLAM